MTPGGRRPNCAGASRTSVKGLYGTEASRIDYADTVAGSPSTAVFSGPGYGTTTLGGISVAEAGMMLMLLLALPGLLLVVRHTRAEEESGRAELAGAALAGRHARPASALLAVGAAELVIAVLVTGVLLGTGLPAAGSVAFGLALGVTGWTFAAVAAVTAQVFAHARTATGAAVAVFGAAFALRAAGDAAGAGVLSWLSPLGWVYRVRPYAGERWYVLALPAAATLVLVAVAIAFGMRRDVGAGLVPARLGRAEAAAGLASAYALAAVLRLRSEETALRAEPLLATGVSRARWAAGHLLPAVAGTAVVLAVAGLTVGVVHGLRVGDLAGEVPRQLGAALVQLPAALVLAGVAVAVYGAVPRLTGTAWALGAAALGVNQLGGLLDLDQWLLNLSPFTHTPKLPGGDFSVLPLLGLALPAVAFAAVGLSALRRRDLAA
ncbi:hypothetical protein [Actinomadura sp. 9N407]|uniref:hypothetical protein n=1 Tax=Actinomadura sp. 9N407 TaxID=3375154 RepID=UPI0037A17531